eukprot:COSAG06_NODE_8832_length_2059_cov_9.016837_2_plen_109_part_00
MVAAQRTPVPRTARSPICTNQRLGALKPDIYQDRLRTNIGNVESTDRFLQGTPGDPSLPKGAAQWARFCDDQNYTSMNHTQGSSENASFAPSFEPKMIVFTKTGSGQT